MRTQATATRVVSAIERACETAITADDLLEEVASELGKAVPFDGSLWLGVDPATLLATAPGRIGGVEPSQCSPFWHREFHVQDFLLYRDLARNDVPVGALRQATDDQPVRSTRYREFLAPQGYGDELRAVFRSGDTAWGVLGLFRDTSRPAFGADDVWVVNEIVASVAIALRDHVLRALPWAQATPNPGLLLFTSEARLVSSNAEAAEWLNELDPFQGMPDDGGCWITTLSEGGFTMRMPPAIIPLLARARAVADGHERGPARLRLRGRNNRWLVLHASCLDGADSGLIAVVVEPAKSAEIAPIIIEAYALTARERDIVKAIARGLSTTEMAAQLFLSTHTVRDYVKSVFEKVGVSSRGELVAKLFAEHYFDGLHAAVAHSD
jgi:DNA-binding CsgD family transcriptional regulator